MSTHRRTAAGRPKSVTASSAERTVRPVISDDDFGYKTVNVADQRRDPHSLLNWTERMIRMRKEANEQGLSTVKAWGCALGCYTKAFLAQGGSDVEGTYVWMGFLPFEEASYNPEDQAYLSTLGSKVDSFESQQCELVVHCAGAVRAVTVFARRAVAANDAVTGNDEGNGSGCQGGPHRPRGPWSTHVQRNICIASRPPIGNRHHRLQHRRVVTDDPRIVARRDFVGIAAVEVKLASVVHHDVKLPRDRVANVGTLTAVGASDRLDGL